MVVSAWRDNSGYVYFDWKSTAPLSYDKFLVRYTSPADSHGVQRDIRGGTSGRVRVQYITSGGYRFIVEGCDTGVFGSSCKQGWTISVTA
jgi:hypothetical protein